jgi:hypothetical protein
LTFPTILFTENSLSILGGYSSKPEMAIIFLSNPVSLATPEKKKPMFYMFQV